MDRSDASEERLKLEGNGFVIGRQARQTSDAWGPLVSLFSHVSWANRFFFTFKRVPLI